MHRIGVLLTGLTVLSMLTACHPHDSRVKTVRERLEAGETVVFDQPGFRFKGCPDRAPDWTDMRLNDQSERARIVSGKQGSFISPGIRTCYRVGSRVALNASKGLRNDEGIVQITRIAWSRADKLSKYQMKGKYFTSSEDFYHYMDTVKSKMDEKDMGLVSVVDFAYISGSAADEKSIIDQDGKASSGDGYEETAKDGDSLSRCKNDWTDMVVPKSFHAPILNRQLLSWFDLGVRNCLKQGAVVAMKEKLKDPASYANLKILKIKRFRVSFLDPKYFSLHGVNYDDVKAEIQMQNSTKNEEFMTVIDFEVQP